MFNDLLTTRVGNLAEKEVRKFLLNNKFHIYWQGEDASHPFDGFVFKQNNKHLVEVKAKYPTQMGHFSIHLNDLELYKKYEKEFGYKMIIFYVDFKSEVIYVTTTRSIEQNTKKKWYDEKEKKHLIYFNGLKELIKLNSDTAREMRELSKQITNDHKPN
jgi:hypothetical protein